MSSGPLHGIKVVELAGIGPGPFAAMLLADLGAEVLRVDRPGGGLMFGRPEHDLLNRGRRSVAVDLKQPQGVETVLRLAATADVLVEGFRPGVAERLGLGPDDCLARNPRLVYGRMTGWGQDGPRAHTAGHDIGYLSLSGALHVVGRAGGPPQVPANLLGDFGAGGMYLVTGVLAALLETQRSGAGQVVDAAIVDGAAHLSTMLLAMAAGGSWSDQRGTNLLDTGAPFYDVYETSDGEYVSLGALEPQFYAAFVERFGVDDLPDRDDPARWPELRAAIAARFVQRTQQEWADEYTDTDACVAPVLTYAQAADDPHLAKRATYVERDGLTQPAPAPRFSRTPAELDLGPARPGQHTTEALRDWGIDDVDSLLAGGAVVQA
ncbi:MAG: CaiB/BaiF CoA transferase family protein [Nocardioidaceae bacterium]